MIRFGKEVEQALLDKRPIVALESTIISHGMPYPDNYLTALKCEEIIRSENVTPATIAIIKGEIWVGLTTEQIADIAQKGSAVQKVSRRDLAYVISQGLDGATTVSATMYLASLAGIKIFATGGIGGVHRNVFETWDISADLEELAETSVYVVCAGIKAILDLPKTLEYLETKGVPVIGYQTDCLPAFYARTSPYPVNFRLDSPQEIVTMIRAQESLGLRGGMLITNPISEVDSLDPKVMNEAIEQALISANQAKITGKDITPFLLKTIKEITGGDSLKSNIQLIYNNCYLGANIAKELGKI